MAGWVFSVRVRRSSGPLKIRSLSDSSSAVVRFRERLPADVELVGERLAHADCLRTLSGKNQGNHDCSVALCVRLRIHLGPRDARIIWLPAMRDAIATALRTAFTDERP